MTTEQYEFWDKLEFPILLAGGAAVPLIFVAIYCVCVYFLPKTRVWVSILIFVLFALLSLGASLVLAFCWSMYLDVPLQDAYAETLPADDFGNKHVASNLVALLFAFLVACSANFVVFLITLWVRVAAFTFRNDETIANKITSPH